MYTADFFRTKLGQAALVSIAAMTAMIALTGQMSLNAEDAYFAQPDASSPVMVEIA
ncbi:MAG: hypothetical protein AAF697_11375 [Pseudomonadota bacterium]